MNPNELTLRDYFAGQAMVSVYNTLTFTSMKMTPENVAKLCYERADAMLKIREGGNANKDLCDND